MNHRTPAPFLSLIILVLVVVSSVHAIGMTNLPTQRDFVFTPGMALNISIGVTGAERISTQLYSPTPAYPETLGTPEDDNILSYVHILDPAPNTSDRTVTIQFALPQQMKSGDYIVDFYATELGEGTITPMASLKMRFTIHVASDEKRIEILNFNVPLIPEGINANASITIISRTKNDLNNVFSEVRVYRNDAVVATARSTPISLPSGQTATLNVTLDTASMPRGDYVTNGTVYFDGLSKDTWTDILKIGTLHVDIPEYTHELTYNTTNRFTFTVSNQWNRELQEVYATVNIGSQGKNSASVNIPAFGKTQYELYFDRDETLLPGTVTANVTVLFKDYDPPTKSYIQKHESFLLPVNIIVPNPPIPNPGNTTPPVQPPVPQCSGCIIDGKCAPYGTRVVEGEAKYCNLNGLDVQKADNSTCQNNYECVSNQCYNALCVSVEKDVQQQMSLLQRIVNWFKHIFG